jgi:hypothetical protein
VGKKLDSWLARVEVRLILYLRVHRVVGALVIVVMSIPIAIFLIRNILDAPKIITFFSKSPINLILLPFVFVMVWWVWILTQTIYKLAKTIKR